MDFDFDEAAYPEIVKISGEEYKASRQMNGDLIFIPYAIEPDTGIGEQISLKAGPREIIFKVMDAVFTKNGSGQIGTTLPHLLTLKVENVTASAHKASQHSSVFNIGTINGEQFQVGNGNTQIVNITIHQLVEKVSQSSDLEAKGLLRQLLENSTVASLVGAGASALLGAL